LKIIAPVGITIAGSIIKTLSMPTKKAIKQAKRDKQQGKSASTQAGEFVKEEIDRIRKGKHGARNAKQAIAIGLSEARRAGVKLKPPKAGTTSEKTRKQAERELKQGPKRKPVSAKRSQARVRALKREGTEAASHTALSRQAHSAARRRTASDRSAAAKKAARTKGARKRSQAAQKAARTRARAGH
jgi:hypothetical protein